MQTHIFLLIGIRGFSYIEGKGATKNEGTRQYKIFIIIRELHENRFGKEIQLLVQLQSLLLNLSRFIYENYHISNGSTPSLRSRICTYIEAHIGEPLSLNELATDSSLENISARSGFASYSSFFRYFKKEYGVSPKEYRNMLIKQLKKS